MPGLVLLVDRSALSRIICHALEKEFQIDLIVREATMSRFTLLKRRVKRLGWRTTIGQVLFAILVVPWLTWESRRRRKEILLQFGLDESPLPPYLVVDVRSVNSDKVLGLLQSGSPKVIVVNGTRLLEERMLKASGAVLLNTHVGITPRYRGVHGGYWALASKDPEHCGVTIHKIDKGIDTGDIVAQAIITPSLADNFMTYPLLQIAAAIPMLKHAVNEALGGTLTTLKAPDGGSQLWSHPTALQYLKARSALGVR